MIQNVTVIGFGEFGCSLCKETSYNTILIDWRNKLFKESMADVRIKVNKNADYHEESIRIQTKLTSALKNTDIIFVAVNTAEEIPRDYAVEVTSFLKELSKLTVGIMVFSSKGKDRVMHRLAKTYCEKSVKNDISPYSDFPEEEKYLFVSLANCCYKIVFWSETESWTIKSYNDSENTIIHTIIAKTMIEKTLKVMETEFLNTNNITAEKLLKGQSELYITSINDWYIPYGSKVSAVYTLERKILNHKMHRLSSKDLPTILAHLIIPSGTSRKELEYLCIDPDESDNKHNEILIIQDDGGYTVTREVSIKDVFKDYTK